MVNVASNISGTPASCAISAKAGISVTSSPGLPIVSAKTSLVWPDRLPEAIDRGGTLVVSIPNLGNVWLNTLP